MTSDDTRSGLGSLTCETVTAEVTPRPETTELTRIELRRHTPWRLPWGNLRGSPANLDGAAKILGLTRLGSECTRQVSSSERLPVWERRFALHCLSLRPGSPTRFDSPASHSPRNWDASAALVS